MPCLAQVTAVLLLGLLQTLLKHESLFQLMHFTDQNADRVM